MLFVGSFKNKSKSGHVGGQMFASTTLVNSELSEHINWLLLDTTADSNTKTSFLKRAYKAFIRLLLFKKYLLFNKVDKILIFVADGFSFIEKGLMVLIGKLFRKEVILAPRSGVIVKDFERSSFFRWWVTLVINKADKVICQGEIWKKFYSKLIKKDFDKLIVIQNWIDISKYKEKKNQNKSKDLNVLFLAWVIREKGIFELIEAANDLKEYYPNIKYVIGGKGDDLALAKQKVSDYSLDDRFMFKGWVLGEEKLELLRNSDIFVLPTYFEGFPNSLVEAMASELPCIATKVGAIPDLIQDNINGLLINPKDSDDLRSKLKMLYDDFDLRCELSSNARRSILDNNTINAAISKFKSLLEY